jgi:hypothetical protein
MPRKRPPLKGALHAGDRLIWEPDDPVYRTVVEIVQVAEVDGQTWVEIEDRAGGLEWLRVEKVRACCIRAGPEQ